MMNFVMMGGDSSSLMQRMLINREACSSLDSEMHGFYGLGAVASCSIPTGAML